MLLMLSIAAAAIGVTILLARTWGARMARRSWLLAFGGCAIVVPGLLLLVTVGDFVRIELQPPPSLRNDAWPLGGITLILAMLLLPLTGITAALFVRRPR